MNKFQMRLIFFKKKKGYTNDEISRLSGLPVTTISRILSGKTGQPTISTLEKLAKAFDCKPDELLGTEENVEPYFFDPQTAEIAKKIKDNADFKRLLDIAADLSPDELKIFIGIINMIKNK